MALYMVNEGYSDVHTVHAARFETVGDFVDFFDKNDEVVFRVRAASVITIERTND